MCGPARRSGIAAFKVGAPLSDVEYVDNGLPQDRYENGGFPDPPPSEPVRVVAARHDRCGARTRVRLPAVIPADAVRRVRCAGCEAHYEADVVEEIDELDAVEEANSDSFEEAEAVEEFEEAEAVEAASAAKRRRFAPSVRSWRWLSVPVGAAAVIGVLLLIQGGDPGSSAGTNGPAAAKTGAKDEGGNGKAGAAGAPASEAPPDARLVRGARFAMALPSGWERTQEPDGATFAAAAVDGDADATLWIEREPDLGLDAFATRSLEQLRSLAGSARVADRVNAPRPEGTIIRLAADPPEGEPRYEVTLRAAGPYRYYLATTLQPEASRVAIDGVEIIHGSFIPERGGAQ
jgi:hypothetical protein